MSSAHKMMVCGFAALVLLMLIGWLCYCAANKKPELLKSSKWWRQ